ILFLAGLTLVIGTQKTMYFFARPQKFRGTICFFGGIFLIFIKWPIIGIIVEFFGFINLFGDFFPVIIGFLRRLPVIGNVLSAPGISKIYSMNFFKSKPKTPHELARNLKESIQKLEGPDKRKATDDISKILVAVKTMLYGDSENDPVPETVAQLAQEVYSNNLLQLLVDNIAKFEFEAKKDVAQIFNNLLRRHIGSRSPTVEYLCTRDQILFTLIQGYENQEIALNCGMILRECLRHEVLTKIILNSQQVYKFFDYVEMNTFDIASDAFATFKEILTRHKTLVAEFLERNYDDFFDKYTQLLQSTNYVTKRQSLKLLGEILLDRANFTIMTRYIASADNLKLMMNLLKDKSRNIQFEAFHVFKVFVANPNKNKPVLDILSKNQDRLISFLSTFHNDRNEDEQFNDEKAFLLKQIQDL
ncbi:mo25 protein, partial [Mortierella sp. AM989]